MSGEFYQLGWGWAVVPGTPLDAMVAADLDADNPPEVGGRREIAFLTGPRGQVHGPVYRRAVRLGHHYAAEDHIN